VLLERVGEPQHQLLALARRGLGVLAERPAGRLDGAVDVLGGGDRLLGDDLAGGGVDDLEGLVGGRVDRRAVDEVLEGADSGCGHAPHLAMRPITQ
jgi:hypothetical protein